MAVPARLLGTLALGLSIVGCACRGETTSSAGPRASSARRWPQHAPGEDPSRKARPTEARPSQDPPAEHLAKEPASGAEPQGEDGPPNGKVEPPKGDIRPAAGEPRSANDQRQPPNHAIQPPDPPLQPSERQGRPAGSQRQPATSQNQRSTNDPAGENEATSPAQEPGVITRNTADCPAWPSYDFPLEIHIDIPDLPDWLTRPARPPNTPDPAPIPDE
jgi:hypothetical protein